eukprot:1568934-Rhodomonas_salina.1
MRQHVGHAGVQFAGCAAIWNLATNSDNKAKIVAEGGLQLVVEAMQKHKDAGVQYWGSQGAARLRSWHAGLAELKRLGSLAAMLCFLL